MGSTTYTYDALGRPASVTNGNGTKVTYTYDDRDRVTQVQTDNTPAVTYTYDGDGNLTRRQDSTGVTSYTYDGLSRETVRTLQDGSQTVMAYTASEGNLDYYRDPQGTIDYTYDAANRLTQLKAPDGKVTEFDYNNDDSRTKTTYPGGTVQSVTLDDSQRPQHIKATSPAGTLVDLTYDYSYSAGGTTVDGTKIRTKTDQVTGYETSYSYDSAGRFSYAKEMDGTTKISSWQYCYDKAGNLTSQGITEGCPRGTKYTVNAASQITSKKGDSAGWSYDKAGNETAGASTPEGARTDEQYTSFDQLEHVTVGGTSYDAQYAGTTNTERTRLGTTLFHHGPLGMSAQTTAGVDTGFVREPAGTLNSMTVGGKSYYYLTDALGSVVALTDASGNKVNKYSYSPRGVTRNTTHEQVPQPYRFAGAYQDPTGLYKMGARYYDTHIGRFTQPDPSGKETNPYLYASGDYINRTDPTGTANILGISEDIKTVTGAFQHGLNGNTAALWGDVAGVATGIIVESACQFVAGLAAAPTAGVGGVLVETACIAASSYAGKWASGVAQNAAS